MRHFLKIFVAELQNFLTFFVREVARSASHCIKLRDKKALQDIRAKYIEDSCDLFSMCLLS